MQKILIFITVFMLIGCAHKIDIQQGNVVSEEMLASLQPGMTPRQVVAVMGSPMLQDPFHADRWDYYYSMRPGRDEVIRYGATLYFADEQLLRIERWGPIPEQDRPRPAPGSSRL